MSLTTTVAANTIREAYEPGFHEEVFRNDSLFGLFGGFTPAVGDTAHRWKINSAGNISVEIFTEGAAQPNAGNQTFVNAAVSWTYFRVMLQIWGHAKDALKSNWVNHIDEEAILARGDLIDLMTTSFMGSTYGIELAVDYGSAYAGITRNGAAGYFESTETNAGGALAWADLIDLRETIRDNDKGGRPGLVLTSENQVTNIYSLDPTPYTKQGMPNDAYSGLVGHTVAGMPLVGLPDWTDTVICMLDMRPGKWKLKEIRPFSVKEMAPSGDSDVYQLSWGGAFVNERPRFDGKLTGVTA